MLRSILAVLVLCAPATADAFCGVYVDAGGAEMYNNATQVVLMREGTRTVLAMQNNYDGPVKDFAMVVPVPAVLKQADVRTISRTLFARVNAMSAPRLVEYWEVDPCYNFEGTSVDARDFAKHSSGPDPTKFGVKIEAQFDVDEYQIVILSATESTGLEKYLRAASYKIPAGAAPLLRPYVEGGSKFFVAKVDPKKVKFVKGQAELSPLRFHYDSDEFVLPIRLGLANSNGAQDLIVNILSPGQRFEVANYPNAYIPTNIDVVDDVRDRFSEFYAALFDRTVQQNPGAVITEYAWAASSCDPCPGYRLTDEDFAKLGEEVLIPRPPPPPPPPAPPPDPDEIELDLYDGGPEPRDFVLTRLHARYGKSGAPNDLVFRVAPPIAGGAERREADGKLSMTASSATGGNRFQARYIIRHPWTKPVDCEDPKRGRWGADPEGGGGRGNRWSIGAATESAKAPRGTIELQHMVAQDVPLVAIQKGIPLSPPLPKPAERATRAKGCGCGAGTETGIGLAMIVVLCGRRRKNAVRPSDEDRESAVRPSDEGRESPVRPSDEDRESPVRKTVVSRS